MKIHLVLIVSLMSACQSRQIVDRVPAQVPAVSSADQTIIDKIAQNDAGVKVTLAAEIRSLIMVAAWGQQLSSSYDLFLDLQLSRPTPDEQKLTELVRSEMSCKLWENFVFTHAAEERLRDLQNLLLGKSDGAAYNWFLNFFKSTKGDTPAQILAKAQMARMLLADYAETCQSLQCLAFPNFPGSPVSAFDPFNDQEMLRFKNKFVKKISVYTPRELNSMPKGNCFADSVREPNAEKLPYDWKVRNKMGRKLQNGEFTFTYDDGPHAKHTLAIADAWGNSGLSQPTFFWLADNVLKFPAVTQEIHRRNLEIAVHSFNHPDIGSLAGATEAKKLNKVDSTLFAKELKLLGLDEFPAWQSKMLDHQIIEAQQVIAKAVGPGAKVTKFRLPYGSGVRQAAIGSRLAQLDMDHYFWDIDSLDWQDKNPLSIVERVRKQMSLLKKGIILFHDIHPQSVEASKILIQEFKNSKTEKVVNLDEAKL